MKCNEHNVGVDGLVGQIYCTECKEVLDNDTALQTLMSITGSENSARYMMRVFDLQIKFMKAKSQRQHNILRAEIEKNSHDFLE